MDSNGRFYLLERPNPHDVQDKLWMMVLSVTKARDEMKEQLKRKVEELKRKEEALLDWQHHLDVRERKLDDGDEGLSNLMRELRVKETVIVDKDIEIRRIRKELDDSVRRAREDVRREIEVCVCFVVLVIVMCLFRTRRGSMGVRRVGTMMGGRCVIIVYCCITVLMCCFFRRAMSRV